MFSLELLADKYKKIIEKKYSGKSPGAPGV